MKNFYQIPPEKGNIHQTGVFGDGGDSKSRDEEKG